MIARREAQPSTESKPPTPGSSIKNGDLGEIKCSDITTGRWCRSRWGSGRTLPQTVGNYFSHLSKIFTVDRPAWGYPLSPQAFEDGLTVIKNWV